MPPAPTPDDDALRRECHAAARRVLANHGWALVDDEAAFVAEVMSAVQASPGRAGDSLTRRAERAVIHAYCPCLYAACCAGHGRRAAQAFDELGRYLHAVARSRSRDPQRAQDAAQRALESVWQHLDDVREPEAFLGYARVILLREMGPHGASRPELLRFVPLRGDDAVEEEGVVLPDPHAAAATDSIERAAAAPALRAALRDCLRSAAQREVIERLFLAEESVTIVADALATTPANVWVLKSRALSHLRRCPEVTRALAG